MTIHKSILDLLLIIFILSLSFSTAIGQSAGDYRSALNSGNWTSLATWERYDGSAWNTPTAVEGWPGQFAGTGDVTIVSGDTVTAPTATTTTQAMGTMTVNGTLLMPNNAVFTLSAPLLAVISGIIEWNNKGKLILPENAVLNVSSGWYTGSCNNNQEIDIGNMAYATCTGGNALYTFKELEATGGSLDITITSNSPVCSGSDLTLTGEIIGAYTPPVNYEWSGPNGFSRSTIGTNAATNSETINSATTANAGEYSVTVTDEDGYTLTKTASVIVNTAPSITDQPESQTAAEGESVTFSVTADGEGVSYQWRKDGNNISGADSSSYTIDSATTADAGNYTGEVSNACGTVESDPATLTVTGAPAAPGKRLALDFIQDDGNNDSVTVSADIDLNSLGDAGEGALEAWIYPRAFEPGAGIVFKGTSASGVSYGFKFGDTEATAQNITFVLGNTGTGDPDYSATAADKTLEANQWSHIACVWSGTTMRIYVNGIAADDTGTFSSANIRETDDPIAFGMNEPFSVYFEGVMDEVRLWSTARSESDIKNYMCRKLTGSETNLEGYWRLDEDSATLCGDTSGNGYGGSISNALRICSEAPIGDASAYDYTGIEPSEFEVNLAASAASDNITVTGDGGLWDETEDSFIQVYRVDSAPNYTSAPLMWQSFDSALRYWGVFKPYDTGLTYEMVYNYAGYPTINDENSLQMAFRKQNCDQWKDLNAEPSTDDKTLTKTNLSGTEFILGSTMDPRNAIEFDGVDDFVEVAHDSSLDLTTEGTLEAWINLSNSQAGGIINKGNNTDNGYSLAVNGSDNILFSLYNDSGYTTVTSATALDSGWYHIAAVWDGQDMNLYINGVLDPNSSSSNQSAGTNTNNLTIGADSSNYFSGDIDEVRVWNIAREQGDIRETMCQKTTSDYSNFSNLMGCWRFDEETASPTCPDYSNNDNDGTMDESPGFGDIRAARVCSSAPIGDDSAYDYCDGCATGDEVSAQLSHPDGDYMFGTANSDTTWTKDSSGLHIYRVDEAPVYLPDLWDSPDPPYGYVIPNGLTPPNTTHSSPSPTKNWSSIDYYRYWGVFVTDWDRNTSPEPEYDVTYYYDGNPMVPIDDSNLGLARRDNFCDRSWDDPGATLDTGADTLFLAEETGTEYILGGTDDPLAIVLISFTAAINDRCIDIAWETATEVDTIGFQLWRSEEKNGTYTPIPESYTAAKAAVETAGAGYSFTDCHVVINDEVTYYYKLEEIGMDSTKDKQFHGPIGPVTECLIASQTVPQPRSNNNETCFISILSP